MKMSSPTLIIYIIVFLVTHAAMMMRCSGNEVNATSGCDTRERNALLKLKASFYDPSNRLSSWNTSTDCCTWAGVECDRLTGHVEALHLQNERYKYASYSDEYFYSQANMLSSEMIDSAILELKHLSYLDLTGNDFQESPIPSFLGLLNQLHHLNLSSANFSGAVPHHLGNLSRLNVLDLNHAGYQYQNQLIVDDDFMWASRLSLLLHLDMGGVNLNGTKDLLKVLDMLPSIEVLHLSYCRLENRNLGRRAFVNSSLSHIQVLDLGHNSLDGELPSFLGNLTSLRDLDLSYNSYNSCSQVNLHGLTNLVRLNLYSNTLDCKVDFISQVLGNNCHMESLDLAYNYFSRDISKLFLLNLSRCPNHQLATLDLLSNKFYGKLPEQIGAFRNLKSLILFGNNISGPIPTSIGNLSALTELDLRGNQLSGDIPLSLGKLSNLEELGISNNQLDGTISETHFSKLSKLQNLELGRNNLIRIVAASDWVPPFQLTDLDMRSCEIVGGEFPKWLQTQKELTDLDMSNCSISGTIPYWFHYINVSYLYLSNNHIEGPLPDSLFEMKSLHILDLSNNHIEGPLPDSLFQMKSLTSIFLSNNHIEGPLPDSFYQMKYFSELDLSNNHIEGPLPDSLCEMKSLWELDLSNNRLSGNLPECWPDSLDYISLSNNSFSGEVPHTLRNCTQLRVLDLSSNGLSGHLPEFLTNFSSLTALILSSNRLSGVIPKSIGGAYSLEWLQLNNNSFTGEVPSSLRNCTALILLDVGENSISGKLPKWIGNDLLNLKVIRLRSNQFYGSIPLELCQLSQLQLLDLASNKLREDIPGCFGNFSGMVYFNSTDESLRGAWGSLTEVIKGVAQEYLEILRYVVNMDLSDNDLIGEIPMELTKLTALHFLNLSHNQLQGNIPGRIGDMKLLESLDMSNNNLSGSIPVSFSDLTSLSHLNLSHNNLTGEIPVGRQLETLEDPSIYEGNPGLCGPRLLKKCHGEKASNAQNVEKHAAEGDEDTIDKIWLYGIITSGFATGFWGAIGVLVFKRSWRYVYFRFTDGVIARMLGR